jgi:selenocysteine-specific elongation factor
VGTVGIVDVPGHEAFVRTMVAGASGIDVALLVIAADEGVMPQTREHLSILTLLGTRGGVIVLTKADLADDDWLALVEADVVDAVRGTPLEGAAMVRTSATTGVGLDALRSALGAAVAAVPRHDAGEAFRMPVDRAFSVRGTGTVVTGTVWDGSVANGDTVIVQPGGRTVRVRGVQAYGADVARAGPATRAAVAVTGVDLNETARGSWLCGDPHWPVTSLMRAEVSLLDDTAHPVRPREWIRLHLGTADVGARVVAGGGALQPGDARAARIVLQGPVLARAGDRFVLRRASPPATIGGGVVVDPLPPRRRSPLWERLDSSEATLGRILREAGGSGVERSVLPARSGLPTAVLRELLGRPDVAAAVGSRIYHPAVVTAAREALERLVREGHRIDPLGEGQSMASLPSALPFAVELVEQAVADLAAAGRIERRGAVLTTPGWQPVVSADDLAFKEHLLAELRAAGAEPPDVAALGDLHHRDPVPILRIIEREGLIVGVEPGRFYAVEVVDRLVTSLRDGMTENREYSPSELREVLGLSRKYLIPFLEYCDRKRITERRATGRVRVPAIA